MSMEPYDPFRERPVPAPEVRKPEHEPPYSYEPVQHDRGLLKRLGGVAVGAGLLLWKLFGPIILLLKNLKFLTTGLTFLVSVGAYATIWGWRFALGFTVLLFVHEMGHVIQLRREGVPASAPLFIPFLGAVVGMKGLPQNAWVEAKVGLAGPVLGSLGALATLILAEQTNSDLLRALAYTGFLLNLFNLIPVLPLDGGRAAAAFHPAFWLIGLFGVAALFFKHESPILLVILLLGGYELYHRWGRRKTPEARAYHAIGWPQRIAVGLVYLGLVAGLVLGMDAAYIHRTF
jgi:Zn-dependent protease